MTKDGAADALVSGLGFKKGAGAYCSKVNPTLSVTCQ